MPLTRETRRLLQRVLRTWSSNASDERVARTRAARRFDAQSQSRTKGIVRKSRRKSRRKSTRKSTRKSRGTKLSRRKLLKILSVPNWWVQEVAESVTVPAASAVFGSGVEYHASLGPVRGGGFVLGHYSTYDIDTLFKIAHTVLGVGIVARNFKFFVTRVIMRYRVVNASNGYVNCTAYFCRFRQDIPDQLGYNDIQKILDQGFINNGYNDGMRQDELTPFQSGVFCELCKIQRVRHIKLEAGKMISLSVVERKSRAFNLGKYVLSNGSNDWSTVQQIFTFIKGSRFILFKFTGQMATNTLTGTTTFTAPKVQVQVLHRTQYTYIPDVQTNINVTDAIGIAQTIDPRIITEDTDLVSVATNA